MNKEEFQTKKNDIDSKIRELKNQKIQLEKEYIESNQVFPVGSKVCITVPAHERNNESILVPEAKKLAYIADYEIDDYCRCCPIKDESCWLKGFKKPSGKKGERKPIRYCDTCKNFKPDERVLDDDEMEKVIEESAKQHYSDLCALNHPLRFKVNHGYSDLYDGGFYRNGCKDYKKIDNE